MGKKLRYLGLGVLAATVWLYLAEAADVLPQGVAREWGTLGLKASIALLLGGTLLSILRPIGRELRRGHCARCGSPTERGQVYCLDHLRETVNEYRDQSRGGLPSNRPGRA